MAKTPLERFSTKYRIDEGTKCWVWTAFVDDRGYGTFRMPGGTRWAHRVAYELLVGPIPDGMQVDHRCRNPSCVNPKHLEPVTPQANTDRSSHAKRSYCELAGHPLGPDNVGERSDGKRYCKTCHREKARAKRARDRIEFSDPAAQAARWAAFCEAAGLDPATGRDLSSRS